jgi:hypothetical protein
MTKRTWHLVDVRGHRLSPREYERREDAVLRALQSYELLFEVETERGTVGAPAGLSHASSR